jgi:ribosomal protein S18 acetylase RimI-like enzyme
MTLYGITRRRVTPDDRGFLLELYATTRAAELAQVPWTDDQKMAFVEMQFQAQTAGYSHAYPRAEHQMIVVDNVPAGRIYWSAEPGRLHILDITIAAVRRNTGIGSFVLREVFQEADRAGKNVTIYVESFNPSCRLFQRLGFQVAQQDGFQLLLERTPIDETHQPV